jgi:transcriptional regulator with XRE-family HTH domain
MSRGILGVVIMGGEEAGYMTNWNDMLRQIRDQFGWTQQRVAKEAQVTPAYISRLKKGEVKRPSADMIRNLATALGMPMEAVYSGQLSEGAVERERELEARRELEALRGRVRELEEEKREYRKAVREIGSLLEVAVRLLKELEENVDTEEGDAEEAVEEEQAAQVLDRVPR